MTYYCSPADKMFRTKKAGKKYMRQLCTFLEEAKQAGTKKQGDGTNDTDAANNGNEKTGSNSNTGAPPGVINVTKTEHEMKRKDQSETAVKSDDESEIGSVSSDSVQVIKTEKHCDSTKGSYSSIQAKLQGKV